ncbi:MAG: hypothetical protein KF901_31640, partial [Myxococcales bacterium]|nr:hypothetical protein [Myxococcales bacterium]
GARTTGARTTGASRLLGACLALAALTSGVVDAQDHARRPVRFLYVDDPVVTQPVVVAPAPRVILTPAPAPSPVVVVTHHTTYEPEPIAPPPPAMQPSWFFGVGAGGLALLDGSRGAVPSYALELGVGLDVVDVVLRADLARAFSEGDSLYTAGAGFRYRFATGRVQPRLGAGLESLFRHAGGQPAARAFAATAEIGVDLRVPTHFGALEIGLDTRLHRGLAGDERARVTVLAFGLRAAFRFQ